MPEEIKTRTLPCKLTPEELDDIARRCIHIDAEIDRLTDHKNSVQMEANAKIKTLKSDKKEFNRNYLSGYEEREVEVNNRPDYLAGIMHIVRADTGEIVETRRLTSEEQQMKLEALLNTPHTTDDRFRNLDLPEEPIEPSEPTDEDEAE